MQIVESSIFAGWRRRHHCAIMSFRETAVFRRQISLENLPDGTIAGFRLAFALLQ